MLNDDEIDNKGRVNPWFATKLMAQVMRSG
jgi:hypothetical protein